MAARNQPRRNSSRLGVRCLLERARAERLNRCSDRRACELELNVSVRSTTAEATILPQTSSRKFSQFAC